ncbi:MAG: hypothetical protein OCD00_19415 [Colwellia sp.]
MLSKLESLPGLNYSQELQYNQNCIDNAIKSFNTFILNKKNEDKLNYYSQLVDVNKCSFYIPYRLRDILVASTDDMCRYALYHRIGVKENGTLDISLAARAVFLTKWILKIRPCILDIVERPHHYESVMIGDDNFNFSEHIFSFCNEHFAAMAASIALNIPKKSNQQSTLSTTKTDLSKKTGAEYIICLLDSEEIRTFLYHSKYRIHHQDTFTLLFNRLKIQEKLGTL